MITLAQVIERFEPDYRARYGHTLGPERAQALRAMLCCRSRMAPQLLAACPECAEQAHNRRCGRSPFRFPEREG